MRRWTDQRMHIIMLYVIQLQSRDVNRKPGIRFSVLKPETGSISFATSFRIFLLLLSFSSRKLHQNYQVSDKINSDIRFMSSVYKSFHKTRQIWLAKKSYFTRFT